MPTTEPTSGGSGGRTRTATRKAVRPARRAPWPGPGDATAGGAGAGEAQGEWRVVVARHGVGVALPTGSVVETANPMGSQFVDAWVLSLPDGREHLSVAHTRGMLGRLVPRVGDTLRSDRREPVLTLVADTGPGGHDMLAPACDPARYRLLGAEGHANRHDNFLAAVAAYGLGTVPVPDPLNLFMNVPVAPDGSISFAAPRSSPGDRVRLRVEGPAARAVRLPAGRRARRRRPPAAVRRPLPGARPALTGRSGPSHRRSRTGRRCGARRRWAAAVPAGRGGGRSWHRHSSARAGPAPGRCRGMPGRGGHAGAGA